ncbi:MAG: AI-2E family transporter [Gammaproteobacteria bacterium]|nr:AI-2E family transporter [Gammaproteobacteria bacterium]
MSTVAQRPPVIQALWGYAIIVLILFALLFLLRPILLPIILSLLLASLLEPQVNRLVRMGLTDSWATFALLSVTLALLVGSGFWAGPALMDQLLAMKSRFPQMLEGFNTSLTALNSWVMAHTGLEIDLVKALEGVLAEINVWLSDLVVDIASGLAQAVFGFILVPIITFFLLRDYRAARNGLLSLLPNRSFEKGCLIYFRVTRQLHKYMRGVLIQSGIIAAVASIGFGFIGLEMALLFGILSGLFNLIPYLGPLLSAIPPLLLILSSASPEPYLLLSVVSVVLIAQAVDNLLVVPSLIASTVDLHPLLVILGVIIAGSLFGFWGMLLAIPFMAVSKIILRDLYRVAEASLKGPAGVRVGA